MLDRTIPVPFSRPLKTREFWNYTNGIVLKFLTSERLKLEGD